MSISHTLSSPTDFRGRPAGGIPGPMRPEIVAVLARLKRRIRTYVLLEGGALLAVVLGVLFWLTLAIDWAYFQLTALELPLWFREALAVGAIALVAVGLVVWIVLRYFSRFRAQALALVLERRFPELGTRLIAAVEMIESRSAEETPLTAAMIDRTIDEAVRLSASLPLESVFDRAPLRRSVVAAVFLMVAAGAFVLLEPAAAARWARAFIARDAVYWPRETRLVVKAIVQPGDRIREFHDGQLKHARGVDLVLLVEAPEESKLPASVELRYVLDGGRGAGQLEMVKSHERQFRHTISGLLDSLSLWVSGGDFVMRAPFRVEVVEPPRLDRVRLDCDYPDYTGLDRDSRGSRIRQTVEVQGSQVALPMETSFVLHAKANKPLVAMRFETESERIALSRDGASVSRRTASGDLGPEQPLRDTPSEPFLSSSGYDAAVPFLLTAKAVAIKTASKKADGGVSPGKGGPAKEAPVPNGHGENDKPSPGAPSGRSPIAGLPILIPPDCRMRIELEDSDGITSVEPIRIVINGVADQPPVIQTELRGIGTSVTRKAVIPVAGTITDDYGVAKARFEFRLRNEKDWRPSPFRRPPSGSPKTHVLRGSESEKVERFEVLPLELKPGERLALSVFAEDGDNLNGPHGSRGEEFVFQIVSNEELLSLVYLKEVNLRERFEKIISELGKVQKDLIDHRGRASEKGQTESGAAKPSAVGAEAKKDAGRRDDDAGDWQTAVAICAVRSLHQVQKNAVETASVEDSFRSLLEELVNNGVHTQQMVDRIGGRIVGPLHLANERDFPATDEAIGLFKLAVDENRDPLPQIDASVRAVSTLIARLRTALGEMQDLVKFHEAIGQLQGMIKDQEQIIDSTRQVQKRKRLQELKGLELLK